MGIKIDVNNIGPFERASLEIKPLTVIVGRNSLGKSMLSYLVWTLMALSPDFEKLADASLKRGAPEIINNVLEKVKDGKSPEEEFKKLLTIFIEVLPEAVASSIKKAIRSTFMTSYKNLIRKGSDNAAIVIEGSKAALEIRFGEDVKAVYIKPYMEFIERLIIEVPGPKLLKVSYDGETIFEELAVSMHDVIRAVLRALESYIGHAFSPFLFATENFATLLPDSRAGISRTLLKPYSIPGPTESISYADRQFISLYYRLAEKVHSGLVDLDMVKPLLEELGCTSLRSVFRAGVYTVYLKMWSGKSLHIFRAPSGIRETLTVALALASVGEPLALVIEEPEAHLHPRAQRILARLIAKSINTLGKTVILTTHSDYILYAINNLITLSRFPEKIRELGYDKSEILDPNMVSAYLVRAEGTKAVLEPLEVEPEGIPEEEFAKVAEELANERAKLLS